MDSTPVSAVLASIPLSLEQMLWNLHLLEIFCRYCHNSIPQAPILLREAEENCALMAVESIKAFLENGEKIHCVNMK